MQRSAPISELTDNLAKNNLTKPQCEEFARTDQLIKMSVLTELATHFDLDQQESFYEKILKYENHSLTYFFWTKRKILPVSLSSDTMTAVKDELNKVKAIKKLITTGNFTGNHDKSLFTAINLGIIPKRLEHSALKRLFEIIDPFFICFEIHNKRTPIKDLIINSYPDLLLKYLEANVTTYSTRDPKVQDNFLLNFKEQFSVGETFKKVSLSQKDKFTIAIDILKNNIIAESKFDFIITDVITYLSSLESQFLTYLNFCNIEFRINNAPIIFKRANHQKNDITAVFADKIATLYNEIVLDYKIKKINLLTRAKNLNTIPFEEIGEFVINNSGTLLPFIDIPHDSKFNYSKEDLDLLKNWMNIFLRYFLSKKPTDANYFVPIAELLSLLPPPTAIETLRNNPYRIFHNIVTKHLTNELYLLLTKNLITQAECKILFPKASYEYPVDTDNLITPISYNTYMLLGEDFGFHQLPAPQAILIPQWDAKVAVRKIIDAIESPQQRLEIYKTICTDANSSLYQFFHFQRDSEYGHGVMKDIEACYKKMCAEAPVAVKLEGNKSRLFSASERQRALTQAAELAKKTTNSFQL